MILNFKLKPTYTITPNIKKVGRGKNKKEILNNIQYNFNFHKIIAIKGILEQTDINHTIPYLESMNVDFYGQILENIISKFIDDTNNLFDSNMTHNDFRDFFIENQEVFVNFITDLRNTVEKYKIL